MAGLIDELKRRNVVRVGIAYLVVGWVIMQIIDVVVEPLRLPDWTPTLIIVILAIGLPLALFFSWAYELTPQGVKRTEEVDADQSITPATGRKLDRMIIAALAIAIIFLIYDRFRASGTGPETMVDPAAEIESVSAASIAVLPFTDLSPGGDQEYFADGLSEEILNALVGVDALTVASRTSSFQFKGRDIGLPEIADRLRVAYVLEGSVRKAGGAIRVTGQLIEAASDKHLWSDSFDRELTTTNIFAIQDEIARAILSALGQELDVGLAPEAVEVVPATENLSAYDSYLKGRETLLARNESADLVASVALLEQAVAMDPGYARAWAWLAAAYSVAPSWGVTDPRPLSELSLEAADRALAIDPNISIAYAVQSQDLRVSDGAGWRSKIEKLEKAIALDPRDGTPRLWLGILYHDLGFRELGHENIESCLAVAPTYFNCQRHLVRSHFYKGDLSEAVAAFDLMTEVRISSGGTDLLFAILFAQTGETIAARLALQQNLPDSLGFPVAGWLDMLRDPAGDHNQTRAAVVAWMHGREFDRDHRAILNLTIGAYDQVDFAHIDGRPVVMWLPGYGEFRKSESFKRQVREIYMLDYWREYGFPPQCRPLGGDDFECD